MHRSIHIRLAVFCLLLANIPIANGQDAKPPELSAEEKKLAAEAKKLDAEAVRLFQSGQLADAVDKSRESLKLFEKLYANSKYPSGHVDLAGVLNNLGFLLLSSGAPDKALPYCERGLEMLQKLLPASKYPDGHADISIAHSNLGGLLQAMGEFDKAQQHFEKALAMDRKLFPASKFPDGHPNVALSLNNLALLLNAKAAHEDAVSHFKEALAMYRKLYPASKFPDGHPNLARIINNIGFGLQGMGSYEDALPSFKEALAMYEKAFPPSKYPNGHRELAGTLNNLGLVLKEMGAYEKALHYYLQAAAMKKKLYPAARFPDGHPQIAIALSALSSLYQAMGVPEHALSFAEQALAMNEKLYPRSKYPDGHPQLARCLNDLGMELQYAGSFEKALPFLEKALQMEEKLYPKSEYPDGHPNLANVLSNLGHVLERVGETDKALAHLEKVLSMRQKLYPPSMYPDGHHELSLATNNLAAFLMKKQMYDRALPLAEQTLEMDRKRYPAAKYPDGHRSLAVAISNLGVFLDQMGQTEKALPYYEQALAMNRRLYPAKNYPNGHPQLANSLQNIAAMYYGIESYDKATPYFKEALEMDRKLARRMFATASEAESLAYVASTPLVRDTFLSIATQVPAESASAYDFVWTSKSAITRVLEQRHAAARMAGTEFAAMRDELKGLRRRIDQLLQDQQLKATDRDRLLKKATDDRDRLERELAKETAKIVRGDELESLGPGALVASLPEHSVLLDLVLYTHVSADKAKPGTAGETRTPSYMAFVLAKGQPIRSIALGESKKIDRAVTEWRNAIDRRTDSPAAQQLHDLVWSKLSPLLPAATKTLYISPDGGLARLPWAALPIADNRVLLEDFTLATVPHGPFLLERIKYPQKRLATNTPLLVGGVEYSSKTWANLPGTETELAALVPLALNPPTTLSKGDATPKRLQESLTKVRYAHIATHGYFDAATLSSEQARARRERETRAFGDDSRLVAGKNPLAFTGLVLTNGEVLTGLGLVDLPLENLNLVTLSACETGLGELTGGEGVQGLQRAFHLAGCPNVIASLWKVGDVSTAVLMEEFYARLWSKEKPMSPIEALREAQLTILRNPDRVVKRHEAMVAELKKQGLSEKELASRGFKTDLAALPDGGKVGELKRSPTQWWAAFVLSGLGR